MFYSPFGEKLLAVLLGCRNGLFLLPDGAKHPASAEQQPGGINAVSITGSHKVINRGKAAAGSHSADIGLGGAYALGKLDHVWNNAMINEVTHGHDEAVSDVLAMYGIEHYWKESIVILR